MRKLIVAASVLLLAAFFGNLVARAVWHLSPHPGPCRKTWNPDAIYFGSDKRPPCRVTSS